MYDMKVTRLNVLLYIIPNTVDFMNSLMLQAKYHSCINVINIVLHNTKMLIKVLTKRCILIVTFAEYLFDITHHYI